MSLIHVGSTPDLTLVLCSLGLRGSFLSSSAQSSTKGFNSIHLSRIPGVVQNSKGASKQNIVIDVENTVENDTSEVRAWSYEMVDFPNVLLTDEGAWDTRLVLSPRLAHSCECVIEEHALVRDFDWLSRYSEA